MIGAWGDTQGDFKAWGADVMAGHPGGQDAVTLEQTTSITTAEEFQTVVGSVVTPLLPAEDVLFAQGGFYFHLLALQPWVRFETLNFREDRFQNGNQKRYAGGLNWYVFAQNFKVTAFYERVVPKARASSAATIKNTNHFGIQLQFYYF